MAHHHPDFERFRQLARRGNLVPVYRRLFSDQLTPVLAYRRLVRDDARTAPSFLLESVVGGERQARYSYMGAQPIAEVIAYGRRVKRRFGDRREQHEVDDPLAEPARLIDGWRPAPDRGRGPAHPDALPDFTGGWVGYAGYDTVRYAEGEKLPRPPADDRRLPDMHFGLYRRIVAFDHVHKTILAIAHVLLDEHRSVEAAYEVGRGEADELVRRLQTEAHTMSGGDVAPDVSPGAAPRSNLSRERFERMVERARRYIAAGDVFQVVLSQRFERTTRADPFDIYRALRVINPSPYMFYLQAERCMLVGSSPEILCRVHDGRITNRPLAGTRRRGAAEAEDLALERELLADPKERAEHIMLVDLGRNDVGRVARPGSIRLPQLMAVERYSHVMHISSTVTGELREGLSAWDVLRATLPVGTVSGAPKVRAMQIIDELEPTRRGPYAGAVGFADFAGNMDMAIALRTMVVMPLDQGAAAEDADEKTGSSERASDSWRVHLQAGAGIVADSDPAAEYEETVSKAAALARAIDAAEAAFPRD